MAPTYDAWYVVAAAGEVTREPIQRVLLDESIVLFRTESGQVAALADRCPHAGYSLAKSRVFGETIECSQHGWSFDATGRCVEIPSQRSAPVGIRTRWYPVIERREHVWVWAGASSEADAALIPEGLT